MEPQTQTQISKDTVTMTVVIPKSARTKLDRLKGIYGCNSLACAVSSAIDDIVIPDVLMRVADKERINDGSIQSETTDDPISTNDHTQPQNQCTDDDMAVLDLLKDRLKSLGVKSMGELAMFIDADIIKIRNTQLAQICPAGEMPDDPEIWE